MPAYVLARYNPELVSNAKFTSTKGDKEKEYDLVTYPLIDLQTGLAFPVTVSKEKLRAEGRHLIPNALQESVLLVRLPLKVHDNALLIDNFGINSGCFSVATSTQMDEFAEFAKAFPKTGGIAGINI